MVDTEKVTTGKDSSIYPTLGRFLKLVPGPSMPILTKEPFSKNPVKLCQNLLCTIFEHLDSNWLFHPSPSSRCLV